MLGLFGLKANLGHSQHGIVIIHRVRSKRTCNSSLSMSPYNASALVYRKFVFSRPNHKEMTADIAHMYFRGWIPFFEVIVCYQAMISMRWRYGGSPTLQAYEFSELVQLRSCQHCNDEDSIHIGHTEHVPQDLDCSIARISTTRMTSGIRRAPNAPAGASVAS